MSTQWFYPATVSQVAEHDYHIPWKNSQGASPVIFDQYNTTSLTTVKPLLHISNATAGDIRTKTWYLHLTNFGFTDLPNTIQGIEVQINVKRGRVLEDTVRLFHNGDMIGDNLVYYVQDTEEHIKIIPNPVYGGPTNLWGLDSINPSLLDSTFGLCLRFQSHPYYPHNEAPLLQNVAMRIY